jgi:hypothetical protein
VAVERRLDADAHLERRMVGLGFGADGLFSFGASERCGEQARDEA